MPTCLRGAVFLDTVYIRSSEWVSESKLILCLEWHAQFHDSVYTAMASYALQRLRRISTFHTRRNGTPVKLHRKFSEGRYTDIHRRRDRADERAKTDSATDSTTRYSVNGNTSTEVNGEYSAAGVMWGAPRSCSENWKLIIVWYIGTSRYGVHSACLQTISKQRGWCTSQRRIANETRERRQVFQPVTHDAVVEQEGLAVASIARDIVV